MFLLPGRGPPRLPQPPQRRVDAGTGRRRQPDPHPRRDRELLASRVHGGGWPLQSLRQPRRWIRPRRRRRDGRPQAPLRSDRGRRSDLRRDPWQRRQPGRSQQRPDRSQSLGAGSRPAQRLCGCRRGPAPGRRGGCGRPSSGRCRPPRAGGRRRPGRPRSATRCRPPRPSRTCRCRPPPGRG